MEGNIKYPGSRWLIMFTVFLGHVCTGMMIVAFSPIVEILAEEFGISSGQISFYVIGIYITTSALSIIAFGWMIDRYGAKPLFFIGSLVTLIGALLVPVLTYSITGIIIMRIIIGVGQGPVVASIATFAARWFPPNERGLYNGVVGSGIPIGIASALIIISLLLDKNNGDWRAAEMALSIAPALAMIMVIIMLIFARDSKLPQIGSAFSVDEGAREFARVLRTPAFYLIAACMIIYNWSMTIFNTLIPGYIAISPPVGLGYGPAGAGSYMSLAQLGNVIGAICAGVILDRIFKGNIKPIVVGAFFILSLAALSIRLPSVHESVAALSISLFIVGFSLAAIMPCLVTFVASNMPISSVSKVFSISFGISTIVGSLGVSAASAALHITNSYLWSILMVSLGSLIGVIPTVFLNRSKKSPI